MSSMNIDGFVNKLKEVERDLERAVGGTRNVPLTELMPPAFIRECTDGKFNTIDEITAAYPGEAKTQEELTALLASREWNAFIKANTSFETWDEMMKGAGGHYLTGKVKQIFES
jgi:hypothetical protein